MQNNRHQLVGSHPAVTEGPVARRRQPVSILPVDLSGSVNLFLAISSTAGISSSSWLSWQRSIQSFDHGLVDVILLHQVAETHNRLVSALLLLPLLLSLSRRSRGATGAVLACRRAAAGCGSSISSARRRLG